MNVTIDLDTREHIDLTNPPKLDNNTDIVLSQGRERDDFKRTVEDVKLRISDQVNELTSKFRAYPITSVWDIRVTDSARTLFQGRIERPISYNVKEDFLDVQCWSKNKAFWEKAKITRIKKLTNNELRNFATEDIQSLSQVIQRNCNDFIEDDLFAGYNINALYANRKIKMFTREVTGNILGNVGIKILTGLKDYFSLDPTLTVFDLLTAFSKYYNAEFFIDAETNQLTMQKRSIVQNETDYNLDELILNTEEIIYNDTDEKKYDYIHSYISVEKPSSIFSLPEDNQFINTTYPPEQLDVYIYTNVYFGILESSPSDAGGFSYEYSPSVGTTKWKFLCGLPKPSPDVTHQRLYVKNRLFQDAWYLVYEFDMTKNYNEENIQTVYNGILFLDRISTVDDTRPATNNNWLNTNPTQLIIKDPSGDIWWSYDESTGLWDYIVDYENQYKPIGKILEILPDLKFVNSDGSMSNNSYSDSFYFFNKETDLNVFAQQWQDLFITRGKVSCTVKGLPYRVGDTFVTSRHPKIPAGKYVVKDAKNHLMREKTKLELIKA